MLLFLLIVFFFNNLELIDQFLTTFRNGTGVNPSCFSTITEPRVGQSWQSQVVHSGHPGATLTMVVVYAGPSTGPIKGYGEILVDLGSGKIAQSLLSATGTSDTHSFAVPLDIDFVGLSGSAQGAIFGGAGPELCNALDLDLGWVQGIAQAQREFAEAIRGGPRPSGDFTDGYRSQVIMEAIAESSRTGQALDVTP